MGITVVESRYLRKGAIKQKEAKGILSANATWNSKSRWQIRDSSKYELFGKGEKKADTNDGEGLQAPFTTLQSILTIWYTFLIWTVFRDLFLSPYTTRPETRCPSTTAIWPLTTTQTLPGSSHDLDNILYPNEENQEKYHKCSHLPVFWRSLSAYYGCLHILSTFRWFPMNSE